MPTPQRTIPLLGIRVNVFLTAYAPLLIIRLPIGLPVCCGWFMVAVPSASLVSVNCFATEHRQGKEAYHDEQAGAHKDSERARRAISVISESSHLTSSLLLKPRLRVTGVRYVPVP